MRCKAPTRIGALLCRFHNPDRGELNEKAPYRAAAYSALWRAARTAPSVLLRLPIWSELQQCRQTRYMGALAMAWHIGDAEYWQETLSAARAALARIHERQERQERQQHARQERQ